MPLHDVFVGIISFDILRSMVIMSIEGTMIRFSICVDTIFDDVPLATAAELAAASGASAFEFWGWRGRDLDEIVHAKESAGLDIAAFAGLTENPPNDPARADDAVAELLASIETACEIGAQGLIITGGQEIKGLSRAKQFEAITRLLSATAPEANKHHVMLLVEPVNSRIDHPGALLTTTADAVRLLEDVNQPNVKLLFDIYDQFTTEGTVLATIESNISRIGHFHIADAPGRGEPGTGALDYGEIFKLIKECEFSGYLGLEFFPRGDHSAAVRKVIQSF